MTRFIKFVDDLDSLKARGTNEGFFRGEEYAELSASIAEPIRKWCERNLGVEQLKSDADSQDEPLEVHVVRIATTEGVQELKSLVAEIGLALAQTVSRAAQTVNAETIMTNSAHAAFDALQEAAHLRTVLLRVLDRAKHNPAKAAALLLEL